MIGLLVFLSLVTELTGKYLVKNNHPIYNISCIIEWGLVCLYFNYSISDFETRRLGWYFAIGVVIFGIVNFTVLQPINRIGSNFLLLECMGVSCLSFYAIYRFMLIDDDNLNLQRKVHYWIPVILVFYQCGALWSWVVYNYYTELHKKATYLLNVLLVTNSIITYAGLIALFYLYPKLRKTHVWYSIPSVRSSYILYEWRLHFLNCDAVRQN